MLARMQITWNEIAPRTWLTTVQPDDANVVLLAGDRRAMLVDAGGTAEVGAALLASARAMLEVPVDAVCITHAHDDHWLGLAGMEGVESWGHESLVEEAPTEALRPTHPVGLIAGVDLGGRFAEIAHFGRAHTRSDLIVCLARPSVVAAGDLVEERPQFDEATRFADWPKALDGVLAASGPDTVVVPGHGSPVGRAEAFECAARLASLHATTLELVQQGVGADDLYDAAEDWPYDEATVRAALPLLVDELAGDGVVARKQLPIRGI